MENNCFEIGIIGLGPGGLRAANEALKCGFKTIAFEKGCVGGTCLNVGCIPTKALLHSSEIFNKLKCLNKAGLKPLNDEVLADVTFEEIFTRKDKIVEKFSSAVKKDLAAKGLTLVEFEAYVEELGEEYNGCKFKLVAGNKEYYTKNVIVATGSVPFELPGLEFNHNEILSSNDVLNMPNIPESIGIVGSGAIGVEWARIFSNLGSKVIIFEKAENLLPAFDVDVSKRVARMFKMAKIQAFTGVEVQSFKAGMVTLSDGRKFNCAKILVAVGRQRVLPKITLQDTGAKITVNPDCTTNCRGLYVIGDAGSKKMLAHNASAQAARVIAGIKSGNPTVVPFLKDEDIPSVVYGNPEIASIGLREQDLPEGYRENPEYKIYNLQIAYLAKAWCDNETDGFIKIITKCGKILGAHIISKEASALVTQLQIAIAAGMDVETLKNMVFAHPTFSEGVLEALNNG